MSKINWDEVTITWHDEAPEIDNIEQLVREDCKKSLWGLNRVSDLVFHHVFLGKSYEEDVVNVWGQDEDEELHCEYVAELVWGGIDEDEEN